MAQVDDIRTNYEEIIERLYSDKTVFAEFLGFSGRFYKLPSAQTMAVFSSNPDARMVADYETWQRFNRQVQRGERGIAYISEGAVRYCFDISQTVGESRPFQWKFDRQLAESFKQKFAEEHEGNFTSLAQCVNYLAIDEVNGSIDVITDSLHIPARNKSAFMKSARSMVRQIMAARCEYQSAYKINIAPLDLSALDMLHSKAEFEKLCEWVQLTAKSALWKMEKSINELIIERSIENERNQANLEREGQEILPGDNRGGRTDIQSRSGNVDISATADGELHRGGAGADETADRELRTEMAGVYAGELSARDSTARNESAVRANRAEGGQGSGRDVQSSNGTVGGISSAATDDIRGERGVGEDEDNGVQTRGDGGRGSEAQRNLSADTYSTKTAEEKSSAVSFSEQVDAVLSGNANRYNDIKVCDTPEILLKVGLQQLPMLYTQRHLKEAIKPKDGHTHAHGLSIDQIKKMPQLLSDPVMIYDSLSRKDSIIVLTSELDVDNAPIIASIKPNGMGKYEMETIDSNFITSFYGKESFENHISKVIDSGNLIYWNKQKSQELFSVLGLQSSKGLNNLDPNIIIHQSRNIVNPFSEKNQEKISELTNLAEKAVSKSESNLQFGLLGYGVTVYDTSKTDAQTHDYPIIAHISAEGKINYRVDRNSLNDEDISRIENQAESVKKDFIERWNRLSVGTRYGQIIDAANALPKPQWDVFFADKTALSMDEAVEKYEHALIFGDEEFPAAKRTVTAYRVGDFYEIYNDDVQVAADLLNLAQTTRRGVPMAGFPAHVLDDYKRKFAMNGYYLKIGDSREIREIYENVSQMTREIENSKKLSADTYSTMADTMISVQMFDLSTAEVFHIPEKENAYLTKVEMNPSSALIERLKSAGMNPPENSTEKLMYETDGGNWNKFYIPDIYGNKWNNVSAENVLTPEEWRMLKEINAKINDISLRGDTVSQMAHTEPDQISLFDLDPETQSVTADTYITENESAEKAKAALLDYAESHIAYYDSDIRQAFLNGSRKDFDSAVKTAVDETISDVMSGKISELNGTDFSELYREMYEDSEFANAIYAEISDRLYAKHREIDKGRQAAHEAGLPYDEYPYDPEENYDPYAYDPNRMSDDDYDRMHDLLDAERAEAEKLIGREVRIDDRTYNIEDIYWYSDRPEVKLRAVYDNLDPITIEYLDVVRNILEQQDRQAIEDSIELKIPYTEDSLLHRFLDEHYPDKNPPFALANAMFKYLDEKFSTEDAGYNKTDFEITAYGILDNGEEDFKYDGRFDIGEGDSHGGGKSLVEHIADFNKYLMENKTGFYNNEDILSAKQTLEVLVPYLERGSKLSAEEQEILDNFKEQYPIMRAEESETVKLKSVVIDLTSRDEREVFVSPETRKNPENFTIPDEISNNHSAFEKLKSAHNFTPEALELLERVEKQMDVNGYETFDLRILKLPAFQQRYGKLPRISEKLFDGKLKEIAAEVNDYIKPLKPVAQKNFAISDEISEGNFSPKSKFAANIEAIKKLKQIESENRTATADEQKILAKYVGWGGIPQAFDSENSAWSSEYAELKNLLTDDEYTAARGSVLNAHYTSQTVINAIYKAVGNMGFKSGNVLEPAMGIGNFFGALPEKMSDSKLFGVELDSVTGRIAKQLYPDAEIQINGYENTDFPDNFFDLAVGNVPFGNYSVADRRYDKEHFLIHDYFFAKTLDKVAPGGIVAFVTSKGTLDKASSKTREYLAKRADLIGAIRLPNNAFKGNANTEVTSDIIFLQKREKMAVELPDWCYTAQNPDGISVNQYFIDHPEMILGTMSEDGKMYGGKNTTCIPFEGANLAEQLDKAVAQLKANITVKRVADESAKERGVISATEDVRNFTYAIVDGKMYFRENNIMTEVVETGEKLKRMTALHELRNTMRDVITAQENRCSDEELSTLQTALNEQYDVFVKKYGNVGERANSSVFSDDDDYNLLCALENYDSETKKYSKSDIFTKRTVKPIVEITHVDTPQEALQVSLDIRGKVDLIYVAQLCEISPESAVKSLVGSNQIFLNPEKYSVENPFDGYEEASEYLSGNVREKLRIAQKFAADNPEFERNIKALEGALPQTIEANEIFARIGVNWVDIKDYAQFMKDYAKAMYPIDSLRRTPMGEYKIEKKTADLGVAATSTYGTKRLSSYEIFERLLNNRDIVVRDPVKEYDDYGKERIVYIVNSKEARLAQDKADLMKAAFKNWLFDDPARREKYVARYNELFNSIVGREYDGSHQTFPGMSPFIKLNPHQMNAVMRAKLGGNTLLAHCVGAGKSFEMVAATMEKKRLGLINKACVVVPKPLVRQMASEWLRLYPNANILVAGEKDFTKENRQKFIGRCCTGNYDAVIMSYEQFEKIPMSVEFRRQFLERELKTIESALSETDKNDRRSVKDLEGAKKKISAKIQKLLDAKTKDEALTFEQLGFDSLVVDEAHNYKNGLVVTKMTRVAGVQTTAAQKSEDILMKTQWLNEQSGYKNILFATGTPVSNSMVELYTMQRYLRPDLLQNAGLENFDDWASTFGEVVTQLEPTPDGTSYQPKKRFAKFANLPELMLMYKDFADIRTAEMLKLPVPEIEGGKPQTVLAKPNEFQQGYVKILAERSKNIHNGKVDPHVDNMLKITHEARLLGLDARCINPAAENDPESKVNLCIDRVMDIYRETSDRKGVQVIFCDIAINDKNGKGEPTFSVYNYIREELARRGIPPEEICAAGDASNEQQRTEMFSQLNSGAKRVLLASTGKMGTGANFQQKLCALHNLDIPWKPSDLEQRLGRIVRRGNENKTVKVLNYLTEKTFDSYMMSIIVNKQKFISQIMSGKTPARTCSDVDEMVLNYSEMQAIASGDPRIKEKIELDNDVSRLRLLESEHQKQKFELQDRISGYSASIQRITKTTLPKAKSDKEFAEKNALPDGEFSVKIGEKIFTERAKAGEALLGEILTSMKTKTNREIGEYCGFKMSLTMEYLVTPMLSLHREDGLTYDAETNLDSDIGNITRLENILKIGIDRRISSLQDELEYSQRNITEAERTKDAPFEYADELREKSARLEELNKELNIEKVDEVTIDDSENLDGHGDTPPQKPSPPKHGRR